MTVTIHTYSKPTEWKEHPLFTSFPAAVHICATRNQRDGIRACYGKDLKHIYSFREIIKTLYPRWYSAETQVQQLLRLNKLIAGLNGVKSDIKQAFRKNAMEILNSIRFFTEAGVHPHSLVDEWLTSEKERLFKMIWQQFVQEDQAVSDHINALQKPLLQKHLNEAIRRLSNNKEVMVQELHLVFHGFYFITPEQQVVLKMIRQQQIPITFFHYYDGRFAETFDFIKAFYNDRFGWPSSEEWVYDKAPYAPVTSSAYAFLAAYEQSNWNPQPLSETITAYGSFFDFLHDVILPNFDIQKNEKSLRRAQVISPNADELNQLLIAYYPELNAKKRNFLSYPIGRFFVSIHEIYDNGKMLLSESILTDLFSSGWIFDKAKRINAQEYMHDLHKLFPYLQGCTGKEIKEWTGRLDQLIQQGLMIEEVFPVSRQNRIVRSMRSPFSKIGHFTVPLHRVKQVKQFIESIQRITEIIFGQSSTSSTISQHFKRLKEFLVENRSVAELNAEKEEKKIVLELEERLSNIQDESEFLFEDLKDALHYYLSGKLDDNDENFINGLIEIDGEMFKERELPIYLTGLDEHSLPLNEQTIPWPLQHESFELLCEQHVALQLHAIRNRAGKAISRYLFFIALNLSSERMKLSWIKNMLGQHELQRALYVKQLGLKVIDFNFNTQVGIPTYVPHKFTVDPLKETETVWETIAFEDFLAEYKLCPKRFYYSYITDEYPVFSSDFMHQFLFSEIIKTAKISTKEGFDNVFREVSPFFPQWLDFKKRVSAKTAFKYASKQMGQITQVEETVAYTETRKNFQFPGLKKVDRERLLEKSKQALSESLLELRSGETQTLPAKAGYHCRFCPHIDYCDNAIFGIDLQRED